MTSITKRIRSALRMGGAEIKQIDLNTEMGLYTTMTMKLWVPQKDYKQAQKLLQELVDSCNVIVRS